MRSLKLLPSKTVSGSCGRGYEIGADHVATSGQTRSAKDIVSKDRHLRLLATGAKDDDLRWTTA